MSATLSGELSAQPTEGFHSCFLIDEAPCIPLRLNSYRQAEQDYFEAHKQITALEERAIKALTGENSLDISIVNSMMPKYREKMEQAQRRMEDAKAKMEQEKEQSKEARREIEELVSWAEAFDDAEPETRRMIIARLVERIDIGADYSISIRFRISMKQYTGDVA